MPAPAIIAAALTVGGAVAKNVTSFADTVLHITDKLGLLEDEVAVTVTGNHQSSKKQLFFLAAATAFGIAKNMMPELWGKNPLPSPGLIGVEYDAAQKEVTFILRLRQNMFCLALTKYLTAGNPAAGIAIKAFTGVDIGIRPPVAETLQGQPIYTGPKDTVVGGEWRFHAAVLPFIMPAITPDLTRVNNGGFAKRVILTDSSLITTNAAANHPNPVVNPPAGTRVVTPNPRPVGDARSRGQLTWMVWQSLANPPESLDGAGTHVYDPPTDANRFTGG